HHQRHHARGVQRAGRGSRATQPGLGSPLASRHAQGAVKMDPINDNFPLALQVVDPDVIVEADVREDLRNGKEPFQRIMAAREQVPEGGALVIRATFEPAPLYRVMEKTGWAHHTEQLGAEDWRVWFYHDVPVL